MQAAPASLCLQRRATALPACAFQHVLVSVCLAGPYVPLTESTSPTHSRLSCSPAHHLPHRTGMGRLLCMRRPHCMRCPPAAEVVKARGSRRVPHPHRNPLRARAAGRQHLYLLWEGGGGGAAAGSERCLLQQMHFAACACVCRAVVLGPAASASTTQLHLRFCMRAAADHRERGPAAGMHTQPGRLLRCMQAASRGSFQQQLCEGRTRLAPNSHP